MVISRQRLGYAVASWRALAGDGEGEVGEMTSVPCGATGGARRAPCAWRWTRETRRRWR